jgi:para-aminobenzoate synthetase/4-amino-4-deoxychorismate lyase
LKRIDRLNLKIFIAINKKGRFLLISKNQYFGHGCFMKVLVYDSKCKNWLQFKKPVESFVATKKKEVFSLLEKVEQKATKKNLHAIGFLSYEASPAFDSLFQVQDEDPPKIPYLFFALFESFEIIPNLKGIIASEIELSPFVPYTTKEEYLQNIQQIKNHLENGDAYQVNYTIRFHARYFGDPFSWFLSKSKENPGEYLFYIETEDFAIASLSPELFFEKTNGTLRSKPMKGTVLYRKEHEQEDKAFLAQDKKNQSENLMIVDMIRNDMAKVAQTGSVEVPALFQIETYPTVIQMTSTVTALSTKTNAEILKALFPCASITGAPKIRSMEIIKSLEDAPRGIYTGTIGHIKPNGDSLFNVAIRTAIFEKKNKLIEYGAGGGIVWPSVSSEEWNECLIKTGVLGESSDFYVFESLLIENGQVFFLERHFDRLIRSCVFFGFINNISAFKAKVHQKILSHIKNLDSKSYKMRIQVKKGNDFLIELNPLESLPSPYILSLSPDRVDSSNPFLYHKTSNRKTIQNSIHETCTDCIFMNQKGELTETTRANLVLKIDGEYFTPPVSCGLLRGVFREELLSNKKIKEKILYPSDLQKAEKIIAINSVRGFIECVYR